MKFKQEIKWKKFSEEKPSHEEWVVFFVKGKVKNKEDEKETEDLIFFFGQFKHPYFVEPDIYQENWMYFALINNTTVKADEETRWLSLKDLAEEAKNHFVDEVFEKPI